MSTTQTQERVTPRNKHIGHVIRSERFFRNMTQDELATEIECNRSTLAQYEGGTRRLTPEKRRALFLFFKANPPAKERGWPKFDDERLLDPEAA